MTNVNEAPTNISLSNLNFAESLPAGSVVGTLGATDADGPSPITFAFITSTNPNDNADFEIVGNQLRTRREFDYETLADQELIVRVAAFDDLNAASQTFAFTLSATNAPERPIANDLTLTTNRNTSIPLTLSGDVSSPAFSITQQPTRGSLSGTAPNLTYTPNASFVGEDEFFYTISSGGLTSYEARVAISVLGVKPTVNFFYFNATLDEVTSVFPARVTLSVPADQDMFISFVTAPGATATSGQDFLAPLGVLVRAGEAIGEAVINFVDDNIDEPTESFHFTIATIVGIYCWS